MEDFNGFKFKNFGLGTGSGFEFEEAELHGTQPPKEQNYTDSTAYAVHEYQGAAPLIDFRTEPAPLPKKGAAPNYGAQASPFTRPISAEDEKQATKMFLDRLRESSPHFRGKNDEEAVQFLFDVFKYDFPGTGEAEFSAFMREKIQDILKEQQIRERARRESLEEQKI